MLHSDQALVVGTWTGATGVDDELDDHGSQAVVLGTCTGATGVDGETEDDVQGTQAVLETLTGATGVETEVVVVFGTTQGPQTVEEV